jgi:hypothetical protein
MKRINTFARLAAIYTAGLLVAVPGTQAVAQLTNGLVGYWPMDNAVGCNNQTPDVVNGYNLQVCYGSGNSSGLFLTNFNQYMYFTNDAVRGNAIFYNGTAANAAAVNMYLAFKSVNTNDMVPVNRYSPSNNTVSFWFKSVDPAADFPQPSSDQRIWTESDYIRTYASVIDISPDSSGYDMFLRQTPPSPNPLNYGNFSGGSHTGGTATIIDGTWHNFTLVATTNSPTTNSAAYTAYIDGVLDTSFANSESGGNWKLDTLSIFALCRNGAAGFDTNQVMIDDLAEWSRSLSQTEISNYMAFGITNAVSVAAPLTISQFASDRYTINQGATITLSWQVSPTATDIAINNGVGDVYAVSTCGVGSTNVTVNGTTTYSIVVTRGTTHVTNSITITTENAIAAGWDYVGDFNDCLVGPLFNQGNWQTLLSSPQTAGYVSPVVFDTVTGNHVLAVAGPTELSAAFFGNNGIAINATNTLFFRFYVDPAIETNDANLGGIPDVDINIGASDAPLRDLVDFTGVPPLVSGAANTNGPGPGPAVRIFRSANGAGGPIDLAANYVDNTGTYQRFSYVASVDPNGLATGVVYNVWIDIYNNQNNPTLANGIGAANYFQVTVQKGGDAGTIIPLFTWQVSDRSTNSNETLNEAFLCANTTVGQSTNNLVRFDDFYLSATGTNHTIPVPQGSFILGTPTTPTSINISGVSVSAGSVILNWTPTPTGAFTYTVWGKSALNSGSWTSLQTGISSTSFTNAITGSQNFYKVSSP